MNSEIIEAINNRKLLEFTYDGCHRIVEPHTYGVSTADNEVLSAYQIDGQCNKGKVPDWKLFKIDKIESLIVLDDCFENERSGYRRGDKRMKLIICEL